MGSSTAFAPLRLSTKEETLLTAVGSISISRSTDVTACALMGRMFAPCAFSTRKQTGETVTPAPPPPPKQTGAASFAFRETKSLPPEPKPNSRAVLRGDRGADDRVNVDHFLDLFHRFGHQVLDRMLVHVTFSFFRSSCGWVGSLGSLIFPPVRSDRYSASSCRRYFSRISGKWIGRMDTAAANAARVLDVSL